MLAGWYSSKNEIKEYLNKELNNEIYETKKMKMILKILNISMNPFHLIL